MAEGQRWGPLSHRRGYSQSLMLQAGAVGDTSNPSKDTGPQKGYKSRHTTDKHSLEQCMRGPTVSSATSCITDTACTFCPVLDYSEEGCCRHWKGLGRRAPQALRGWGTHRAVSPARQDPKVVDLAVQLQPAGNREGEEGRGPEGVTQRLQGSLPSQSPWHSQSHVHISLPIATAVHSSGQSHSSFGFTSSCRGRAGRPQSA